MKTLKKEKLIILCTIIFSIGFIISCTHPKIVSKSDKFDYYASKGDSVIISWHFENADAVYLSGFEDEFDQIDSVKVYADFSKSYAVKAYQGNVDSLIERKTLIVDGITKIEEVKDLADENDEDNEDYTVTYYEEEKEHHPSNNEIAHTAIEEEQHPAIEETHHETVEEKHEEAPAKPHIKVPFTAKEEADTHSEEPSIQKGPLKSTMAIKDRSYSESEYLKGIIKDKDAQPEAVRVINSNYILNDKELKLKIKALLLDKYGNFIINPNRRLNYILDYGCQEEQTSHSIAVKSKLVYPETPSNGVELSILLDNSLATSNNNYLMNAISDFTSYLSQSDRIEFSIFNQNSIDILPWQTAETAKEQLNNYQIPAPKGLNASYKSIYNKLDKFPETNNSKALIVITHYNDNASLIYRASDLIALASEKNIPIYIVAVGDALRTYFLKYICAATGGRLYHIFPDESYNLKDILNEIAFGLKNYYEIEFSLFDLPSKIIDGEPDRSCEELFSKLIAKTGSEEVFDFINIFPFEIPEYSQYQAVSLFEPHSDIIPEEYNPILVELAEVMKDNPQFNIELIGNSSNEGDDESNMLLSASRAYNSKIFLAKFGIAPNRILNKGIGFTKPLYFNSKLPWQDGFNRRVEIRWLEPDKYPFEIFAEKTETEIEAEAKTAQWKKRGYKAYYERYIENSEPIYKVKLWGYTSKVQAENEMKKLEKKYRIKFSIE